MALYIGGVTAGLAATAGVFSSTIAAHLLGFPEKDIDAGLYGFNGTLVGPCLFLFLENSPQLWLYVVLASILSTIVLAALMRILQPCDIPASTAPFILTCWMFMAAVYAFDSFSRGPLLPTAGIPVEAANISMIPVEIGYMAAAKGISEVMFADSVVVGILFLAGIAIHSLRGAAMALAGAIVGIVIPVLLGMDKSLIEMGLYAFNPVLAMMAVGWAFLKPSGRSMGLAFLAGIFYGHMSGRPDWFSDTTRPACTYFSFRTGNVGISARCKQIKILGISQSGKVRSYTSKIIRLSL